MNRGPYDRDVMVSLVSTAIAFAVGMVLGPLVVRLLIWLTP